MIRRSVWRISLLFVAIIILAIPIVTPLLELSGSHNHTCSAARCILCTVSSTLRSITDISAIILFAFIHNAILLHRTTLLSVRLSIRNETPIALKTKILS